MDQIDWLLNVEPALHTRNKSIWLWCIILFIHCWIWFANVLLRNSLCSWVILVCSFLALPSSRSGIRATLDSDKSGSSSSASILCKEWHNFVLQCLAEFAIELIWAWCFLIWKATNWLNFFNTYRPIQIVYFFLWVLANFVFQGTGPFHLG